MTAKSRPLSRLRAAAALAKEIGAAHVEMTPDGAIRIAFGRNGGEADEPRDGAKEAEACDRVFGFRG